ncbi:hypothetical protein GCM10010260_42070 [Streptomyces filipinensis]|uniref:Uncharacterized protein n=1 Tax=Streptomyces filipinensis TaxID=66887 RepID=A0A918MCQ7_9ACTN|nr:hypothetical protein GCM10010260_42070 [Streptomyces filipinensis]
MPSPWKGDVLLLNYTRTVLGAVGLSASPLGVLQTLADQQGGRASRLPPAARYAQVHGPQGPLTDPEGRPFAGFTARH